MVKKISLWLGAILIISILILGKQSMDKRSTFNISEEQQKNISIRIVRSYEKIDSIEFLKSYRNSTTGSSGVSFKINNNDNLVTGYTVRDIKKFNTSEGVFKLGPIDRFNKLNPTQNEPNSEVDLSEVKITYLEEQSD